MRLDRVHVVKVLDPRVIHYGPSQLGELDIHTEDLLDAWLCLENPGKNELPQREDIAIRFHINLQLRGRRRTMNTPVTTYDTRLYPFCQPSFVKVSNNEVAPAYRIFDPKQKLGRRAPQLSI